MGTEGADCVTRIGAVESRVLSGPFLVSRTGDAGCSESGVKVPECMPMDTIKSVGSSRQQDGGHGSRNPLRSV